MEDELALLDRAAELGEQAEPGGRVVVALGGVELDADVRLLREVHRDVGAAEQRVDVLAVLGEERDADARLGLEHELVDLERLPQRLREHLGELDGSGRVGDARQEHAELVAAEPGDRVALAESALQPRPERAEQEVAALVPERVVHVLEAVEVDEHHGCLRSRRACRPAALGGHGRGTACGSAVR